MSTVSPSMILISPGPEAVDALARILCHAADAETDLQELCSGLRAEALHEVRLTCLSRAHNAPDAKAESLLRQLVPGALGGRSGHDLTRAALDALAKVGLRLPAPVMGLLEESRFAPDLFRREAQGSAGHEEDPRERWAQGVPRLAAAYASVLASGHDAEARAAEAALLDLYGQVGSNSADTNLQERIVKALAPAAPTSGPTRALLYRLLGQAPRAQGKDEQKSHLRALRQAFADALGALEGTPERASEEEALLAQSRESRVRIAGVWRERALASPAWLADRSGWFVRTFCGEAAAPAFAEARDAADAEGEVWRMCFDELAPRRPAEILGLVLDGVLPTCAEGATGARRRKACEDTLLACVAASPPLARKVVEKLGIDFSDLADKPAGFLALAGACATAEELDRGLRSLAARHGVALAPDGPRGDPKAVALLRNLARSAAPGALAGPGPAFGVVLDHGLESAEGRQKLLDMPEAAPERRGMVLAALHARLVSLIEQKRPDIGLDSSLRLPEALVREGREDLAAHLAGQAISSLRQSKRADWTADAGRFLASCLEASRAILEAKAAEAFEAAADKHDGGHQKLLVQSGPLFRALARVVPDRCLDLVEKHLRAPPPANAQEAVRACWATWALTAIQGAVEGLGGPVAAMPAQERDPLVRCWALAMEAVRVRMASGTGGQPMKNLAGALVPLVAAMLTRPDWRPRCVEDLLGTGNEYISETAVLWGSLHDDEGVFVLCASANLQGDALRSFKNWSLERDARSLAENARQAGPAGESVAQGGIAETPGAQAAADNPPCPTGSVDTRARAPEAAPDPGVSWAIRPHGAPGASCLCEPTSTTSSGTWLPASSPAPSRSTPRSRRASLPFSGTTGRPPTATSKASSPACARAPRPAPAPATSSCPRSGPSGPSACEASRGLRTPPRTSPSPARQGASRGCSRRRRSAGSSPAPRRPPGPPSPGPAPSRPSRCSPRTRCGCRNWWGWTWTGWTWRPRPSSSAARAMPPNCSPSTGPRSPSSGRGSTSETRWPVPASLRFSWATTGSGGRRARCSACWSAWAPGWAAT
jgi:hypothetical protein